jgi:hypothetical protein
MTYYFSKILEVGFDRVVCKVTEELKKEVIVILRVLLKLIFLTAGK